MKFKKLKALTDGTKNIILDIHSPPMKLDQLVSKLWFYDRFYLQMFMKTFICELENIKNILPFLCQFNGETLKLYNNP